MTNRPSPRSLYVSSQPAGFPSVHDAISTPGASDYGLSVTSAALDALKDILEALDTLPCVKYIASVGVKILKVIDVGKTDFR